MVDRARVVETVQMGLEATPGTSVAANRGIKSFGIAMHTPGEADMYRPDGHKFPTVAELNQEWSTFDLTGKPTYNELPWALAMLYGNPAPTTPGGATNARQRVYGMSDTALLTPKTATIEKGSSVRAQKITHAVLTALGFGITRTQGLTMTGSGIGQLFTDGITKTAAPTELDLLPIIGKHFDLYIDAASGDLGTTKMLRAFEIAPNIDNVFGPIWPINSANASFGGIVDLVPATGLRLKLEADAAGMAYLDDFRAGTTIFVRAEAVGPEIEVGFNNTFTYDAALKVKSMSPDEDESGLTVVTFETEFTKDTTWGKALEITLINDVATVA
jgi:hypothetical protein